MALRLNLVRWNSTTTTPNKKQKIYEYSVNLPQTSFSMRANAVVNEVKYRDRCTASLYANQVQTKRTRIAASKNQLFKSVDKPKFTLHDGPPYANGQLHIGTFVIKKTHCQYSSLVLQATPSTRSSKILLIAINY